MGYLVDFAVSRPEPELFVADNQTMLTARVKAGQRPAPVTLRQEPIVEARALVYRCLELYPDRTRAELAVITHLSLDTVYAAIRYLADHGQIYRRGTRSGVIGAVRWTVAR